MPNGKTLDYSLLPSLEEMKKRNLYRPTAEQTESAEFRPYRQEVDYAKLPDIKRKDIIVKKDTMNVIDTREIDATSGKKITDRNNQNSMANIDTIKQLINGAKKRGLDPTTVLAMAMQETGFGTERPSADVSTSWNPLQLNIPPPGGKFDYKISLLEPSLDFLKEKIDYAKKLGKKTEEEIIQAWNGYGKVGVGYYPYPDAPPINKFYGIDVSKKPLDMAKNPVYGKRVVDLRDNVIKKNPDLMKLIEETQ